jgi:hypothetical protein
MFRVRNLLVCGFLAALCAGPATAQDAATPPGQAYRSTLPPDQRRAFFGELHVHTGLSFDAWARGSRLLPDDAYKFGKGESVVVPAVQLQREEHISATGGVRAQRAWPLDFMAVTDHSEWMGVFNQLDDPNSRLSKSSIGQAIVKDPRKGFNLVAGYGDPEAAAPEIHPREAIRGAWDLVVKAANDNYEPGKFTTFIAYEWSSMAQGRYNLHRNVIFNSRHAPQPFTSNDSDKPEDLWSYLEKVRHDGIDVIAIPHNGNASGGLMYDWNGSDGRPIDEQYAQRRATNEPLTEIVQTKGQSDTIPALSPNDEFANFEIFDHLLIRPGIKSEPNGSYIRQAFGRGLVIQQKVGVNPFKYGLVGGSDIHNALSTSDESAMNGGPFGIDPHTMLSTGKQAQIRLNHLRVAAQQDVDAQLHGGKPTMENFTERSSGGLTGVWAETNTRNSIFAALKRKETFATSGTRIRLRMFAGWNFKPSLLDEDDWVAKAYASGVPMGSDLPAKPARASAPEFVLEAVKDADGANLDRIQIIKVWLDGNGYKEKIFDVALSGGRRPDPKTGKAPSISDTVDLKTGKYTNSVGAALLTKVWTDPEFDPRIPAVYYARVLEIPTPRWTTLLAIKNNLPLATDVPATIQERAWTSPIWYTPAATGH